MLIRIISSDKCAKRYYKKKTNAFFHTDNREWVDRVYLYAGNILFRLFDGGISLDSLQDTDAVYAVVCRYIEFLFDNTEIAVYGTYDAEKLSQVEGVRIQKI